MNHEREKLVALIKRWMKEHKNEFLPSFKEVIKCSGYRYYGVPNFSECKLQAFKELQDEGIKLETGHVDKRYTAKILDPEAFKLPKLKPEKKLLYFNAGSSLVPSDLQSIAKAISRLSSLPETTEISVTIKIEGEE